MRKKKEVGRNRNKRWKIKPLFFLSMNFKRTKQKLRTIEKPSPKKKKKDSQRKMISKLKRKNSNIFWHKTPSRTKKVRSGSKL